MPNLLSRANLSNQAISHEEMNKENFEGDVINTFQYDEEKNHENTELDSYKNKEIKQSLNK